MANGLVVLACLMYVSLVISEDPPHHTTYRPLIPPCKCKNQEFCQPVSSWSDADREVIVATDGSPGYEKWMWDSITTILQLGDGYNQELICYAHSKGRKYGFIRDLDLKFDADSAKIGNFSGSLMLDIQAHTADVVALDLLKILGECHNAEEHIDQITNVITQVINKTRLELPRLVFLCVMPWKPPCYDKNCGITPALRSVCDAFILNADSFDSYCPDESCRARATVPFSKLYNGLDEYIASGVGKSKLILGIPWHGYNYTCESFKNMSGSAFNSICTLKQKTKNVKVGNETVQVTKCDVTGSRKKVKLGEYYQDHPDLLMDDKEYSMSQQAPSLSGNGANDTYYQIWYEDYASLATKYSVVVRYDLKGCVIYDGDDLTTSQVGTGEHLNSEMWSWLLHTILITSTHAGVKEERNVAGLVAGVGIGMFVFGCLLGALIACIRFRSKGRLHSPFRKDLQHEEFHDDDDNAL